jgi:sec-independent protein translocase protein TatA
MPTLGFPELIVILVLALIVLGPKKLPSAGRALGESIRGFKESVTGEDARPEVVESADGTRR